MSLIKTIQQVSVTIAAGATSGTATINAVTLATASEHIGGYGNDPNTGTIDCSKTDVSFVLTGTTTVTATRNTSDVTNAVTITGTVIDWQAAAIQSIQRGSIVLASTVLTNTAVLTSVTTTNSAIQYNGSTYDTAAYAGSTARADVQISSATQVTATRGLGTGGLTVYFTVVEFASGVLNSATQVARATFANATGTKTVTISAVTAAQCMLFWGGWSSNTGAANAFASYMPYAAITNGTTVTFTKANAGTGAPTVSTTVVEFKAADIKTINRGLITIGTAETSHTASITAVNTQATIANWLGNTDNTGTAMAPAAVLTNLALTNSTTLTASIVTSNTSVLPASWEAIEFLISFSGTTAVTEQNDSVSATALEIITGAASLIEQGDSAAAVGLGGIRGGVGASEQSDSVVAVGFMREIVFGSAATTEGDDIATTHGATGFRITRVTRLTAVLDNKYINAIIFK